LEQESPAVAKKDALQPIQFISPLSRYVQFSLKNAHSLTPP